MPRGRIIDVRHPKTFKRAGYHAQEETVFIVHGFNGTESDRHIRYLRDGKLLTIYMTLRIFIILKKIKEKKTFFVIAYISREFNVITVNWRELTVYPCYLTALTNTRLVAQCTAQVFCFLVNFLCTYKYNIRIHNNINIKVYLIIWFFADFCRSMHS